MTTTNCPCRREFSTCIMKSCLQFNFSLFTVFIYILPFVVHPTKKYIHPDPHTFSTTPPSITITSPTHVSFGCPIYKQLNPIYYQFIYRTRN